MTDTHTDTHRSISERKPGGSSLVHIEDEVVHVLN
jgi:hypothetical protein